MTCQNSLKRMEIARMKVEEYYIDSYQELIYFLRMPVEDKVRYAAHSGLPEILDSKEFEQAPDDYLSLYQLPWHYSQDNYSRDETEKDEEYKKTEREFVKSNKWLIEKFELRKVNNNFKLTGKIDTLYDMLVLMLLQPYWVNHEMQAYIRTPYYVNHDLQAYSLKGLAKNPMWRDISHIAEQVIQLENWPDRWPSVGMAWILFSS